MRRVKFSGRDLGFRFAIVVIDSHLQVVFKRRAKADPGLNTGAVELQLYGRQSHNANPYPICHNKVSGKKSAVG